jgi:hypothetical protein
MHLRVSELGTEFCRLSGQGAQFEIISHALADGDAAELKIHLEPKDDAAPQAVASDGTTN